MSQSPPFSILNTHNNLQFIFFFASYIFQTLDPSFCMSLDSLQLVPTFLEVYVQKWQKASPTEASLVLSGADGLLPISE